MEGELAQGMQVRVIGGVNIGREGVLTDVWLAGALAGLVRLNGSLVVEAVNVEPLTPSEGSDDPAPEPAPVHPWSSEPFDAFEVHACLPLRVLDPGYDADDAVEQVDDPDLLDEHAEHVLWSVYGHRTGEGIWCIGDFTDRESALAMAHALASTPACVPVYDDTP
jgi:hypothetical protein